MNIVQRNPDADRHAEYHDGEYEYWPLESALNSKKVSIPAALLSGLELLAAVAAAGLLAVALSVLYVISSPLAISETYAQINANVYNNNDGHTIVYTLSLLAEPDRILQDGIMEEDESTLFLENLTGGTTYLLRYYNTGREEIGDFRFTTPGTPEPPGHTEPPAVETESTEPTPPPAETEATEAPTDETTGPTEEETVPETTEPDTPIYHPPTPPDEPGTIPTDPSEDVTYPTDPSEDVTRPTDPAPDFPTTDIIVNEPDMGEITYIAPEDSGDEINAYFQFEEYHTFQNVPADGYSIRITQGGTEITDYTTERSPEGMLFVTFTGQPIPVGSATTSEVTLTVDGQTYTSTNTVFPPSLESVEVTETKNADGTHTFTVIANVDSDGTEELALEAILYTTLDDYEGVTLLLSPESPYRYTATYTTPIRTEYTSEQADVTISGGWARVSPFVYYEADMNHCAYTP